MGERVPRNQYVSYDIAKYLSGMSDDITLQSLNLTPFYSDTPYTAPEGYILECLPKNLDPSTDEIENCNGKLTVSEDGRYTLSL